MATEATIPTTLSVQFRSLRKRAPVDFAGAMASPVFAVWRIWGPFGILRVLSGQIGEAARGAQALDAPRADIPP